MEYLLENDSVKCIIKSKGAELASFFNKKTGVEHIWQADPQVWGRHAPVLFPIVGQVENNNYTLNGKTYTLSQHGFARDREMKLIEQADGRLVFSLVSDEASLEKYPYQFELQISYTLQKERLEIGYGVINKEAGDMWFSIGAHPGFCCPFNDKTNFDDYVIRFEKKETANRLLFADGLLTGEEKSFLKGEDTISLTHELFAGDAIIFENLKSGYCVLESAKHSHGLKFEFEGFPFLAFWTKPGANAPYVCIEPWYGIADTKGQHLDFKQKKGIQKLEQGGVFTSLYAISCF